MEAEMVELIEQLDKDDVNDILTEEETAKGRPKKKDESDEDSFDYQCPGADALDLFIKRRRVGVYLEQLLDKKVQKLLDKKLAQPLPPPPPEPIGASTQKPIGETQTKKQLKADVQQLADYTIRIMKALMKAHMRLTEHQRYAETGTPPKGMTCALTINPFRPRDSPITQTLADLKKEYHKKILESLVTHYTKVISTLESDQRLANEREKALREKHPGDPIWAEFERAVQEGARESDQESSGLFARMSRKRFNEGKNDNNLSLPKRSVPIRRHKKRRRGRPRSRRTPRKKRRKRAWKTLPLRNRRLRALRARLSKIKENSKLNTVVNLSRRVLTAHEHSVLHKGLSFCPTPLRPSKKQLLIATRAFIRKLRLQYHFAQQNPTSKKHPRHPFKPKSTYTITKVKNKKLEGFITALQSLIISLKPTRPHCNVTPEERTAIKNLSSYKDVVIKRADKGSCIVVENTFDYKKEGNKHLDDIQIYKPLREDPTKAIVTTINEAIEHFYKNGPLDFYTREYLKQDPTQTRTQLLYFLKKLHKNPHGVRPICSGSGGPTELISALVDSYLSPITKKQPSYIRDSSHLIKIIETLPLPSNVILVSLDVTALYPSIPQAEAIEICATFAQREHNDPNVANMIRIFLHHILKNNTFLFNNAPYLQLRGTAMGTRTAPSLANLFMADLEQRFLTTQTLKPLHYFRFIDDILIFWTHSPKNLDTFIQDLNSFHPTIKFTHERSEEKATFLDIDIYKGPRFAESGILDIKTHIKPTNKFQYLYYTSSHPRAMKTSVLKGEMHRFLRSTSNKETFLQTKKTLKQKFRDRGYPSPLIEEIHQTFPFEKRTELINKIPDPENPAIPDRTNEPPLTLVIPYDPWFPTLKKSIHNLWNIIENDEPLNEIFPNRPKIAFKRSKNLRDTLVRAKLPTTTTIRTTETVPTETPPLTVAKSSVTPCNKINCKCCKSIRHRTTITSLSTNETFPVEGEYTCTSRLLIYMLECPICGMQYIGQTTETLAQRLRRHRLQFHQKKTLHLYEHFHNHGWTSFDQITIQPIDYIPNTSYDLSYLEQQWIDCMGTRDPKGLNAKNERIFGKH